MKKRSEMDARFMWDFSSIFSTKEEWEKQFPVAEEKIKAISGVVGTLGDSAESMLNACKTVYSASQLIEIMYIYAMLHKSADTGDTEYQAMEAKAMSLIVKISSAASFFNPEVLTIDDDKLEEFINNPILKDYAFLLRDIKRGKAHILDVKSENMLAMLTDIEGTPSDAYHMLADVEMEYPPIIDSDGVEKQLTRGNFNVFRESPDRKVREQAFENLFGTYRKFINTTAALYGGSVKMDTYLADVRGYDSACEKSLFAHNVPISVYDSLISAIHDSLPSMRKYLDLRKEALGLDSIDMFDLYTPMIPEVDFKTPFEDGKALVKKALEPLGAEYQTLLDKAFNEKWIDVYENAGKRSGAFSCGVYGAHPYVLLNYTDTLDDAFTLGHELGHAMHSYFSDRAQPFVNCEYSLMVAEVASTVNEVFIAKYLLKTETDKKRRAYVLNHFLEGFRTTVFRQTLFAEFERKAHDMHKNGEPLTAQALNDLYKSLNEKYYEGIGINDTLSVEWSYIPHFYRAYYVYQYATGFCSAVAIAQRILETGDASGYLKFLTMGGSEYPIDELKVAGVDLTTPDTIVKAMSEFDRCIDELAQLIKEI